MERFSISLVNRKLQIENKMRYHFTPIEMAEELIGQIITGADEDVEKSEHPHTVDEHIKYFSPLKNILVVSQMIKHRATTWPSNSTFRCTLQSNEIYANTKKCVGILTAALIIVDKMLGETQISASGQIQK